MAPTVNQNELGVSSGIVPVYDPRVTARRFEVDPLEYNPELRFPQSIPVYDAMRSQEGHIGAVLDAITLPIVSARWSLDTEGVRAPVTELVRTELGLDKPGGSRTRRRREGIVWKNHVAEAVETLVWAGFSPFEQVYIVSPPRPDQTGELAEMGDLVHLRKLAPRLPRSVEAIRVARDGGLDGIVQTNPDTSARLDQREIFIPVDRLVFYVNRKEGADWSGRSTLRTAYKSWLIKDVLLRLDAQAAERNSMGIPVIRITDESQRPNAEAEARRLRAGAESFLVLSPEMNAELMGVTGSLIDLTPRIKYLDQEMSRSALAMFLDLGHDGGLNNGAALGETFLSVFLDSLQSTADYIAETATEHIIRDLVELNFGPDEPYPVLTPGNLKSNREVEATVLQSLAQAKLITPDGNLENHLRDRYGLPEVDEDSRPAPPPAPVAIPRPDAGEFNPPDGTGVLQPGEDEDEAVAAVRKLADQFAQLSARGRNRVH